MSESNATTPESLEVKRRGRHRLIGAITLAVLAVVIIPMVLDSEPRRVSKDLALTIPPKEGLPPLPAPKASAEAPKPAAATEPAKAPEAPVKPAETTSAAETKVEAKTGDSKVSVKPADKAPEKTPTDIKPAKVAEKPVTKTDTKPAEKVADKTPVKTPEKAPEKVADKPAAKLEGFAIQLGAFSDAEKLAALKAKMKTAKVPVFTENVKTASGSLTRLRAGPYKTRDQADKALVQVKKAGADGQVVPLP